MHVAQQLCQYHTLPDTTSSYKPSSFQQNYLTESSDIMIGNREQHEAYYMYKDNVSLKIANFS